MSTSASKKGISMSISISSVFGCSIDDKSCREIYISSETLIGVLGKAK